MCIIPAGVNASCSALLKRKSWENSKYQGNMIESIFNISQSLTSKNVGDSENLEK